MLKVSKIIISLSLLMSVFSLNSLNAFENTSKNDLGKKTEKKLIKLRGLMDSMEKEYLNLEILTNSDNIDYEKIRDSLDHMEDAAEKILNTQFRPELKPSLENLQAEVKKFHEKTYAQKQKLLHGHLETIYHLCFRCHQAHAPNL